MSVAMTTFLDLQPIAQMTGTVRMPGSKSISNRALLLAALSEGDTQLNGLLEADDVSRMLEALGALGIVVSSGPAGEHIVHGRGGAFPIKHAQLDLGNAGTAFRPLTATLA